MPKKRLSVFGRKAISYLENDGMGAVIGIKDWVNLKKFVGGELPTLRRIGQADGEIVRQLLSRHGKRLYSADELVAAIEELSV